MVTTLFIIYRAIIAVLAVLALYSMVKEKSLDKVISMGMLCVPLILRALMIK